MQKNAFKFFLDSLMFVLMTSIAATGLLLGFVIPRGGRVPQEEKYFLGLHRHDWGDIHLFLAITFLCVLIIHLCMNWTWIEGSAHKYFGEQWKRALLTMCGAWIGVLIIGWIIAR